MSKVIEIISRYKEVNAELLAAKDDFVKYITDQQIPLDVRWEMWLNSPVSIKNTNGWCGDGRLEAFRILGVNPDYAIAYEGSLYQAERCQTINMVEVLDCVIENYLYNHWPCGVSEDDADWELDVIPKVPELVEFIKAYKEEVLKFNLHSYTYDW